jgi:hypothetical protein
MGGTMTQVFGRARVATVVAILLGAAGLGIAASVPAAAQTVSRTYPAVQCKAVVNGTTISQSQDVSVSITAPNQVTPGQVFTITFPGATAMLPTQSNGFTITSYSNIFLTYQIQNATFVNGTIVNPGTAQMIPAGSTTPQTIVEQSTLPAPDQIASGNPGPFNPGSGGNNEATLITPDISVNATAPQSGSVTLNALTLTTTVVLNGRFTANVTCNVPTDTIITIPVGAANTPPTVNAGPDVSGNAGSPIALNGSVTDPDSTPTDTWTVNDPACSFADASAPSTTVTCTKAGTFTATLTANDGVNEPVSDSAQVVVAQATPLLASAGGPVSGAVSHQIALNGTVSDSVGTPTIAWTVNSPACTFANAASASTTISCNAIGSYVATLTADDGANHASDTAAVTIHQDVAPTVDAGPPASGNATTPITLLGTVTDPDDTPTIRWTASDPACSFADATQPTTTITCSVKGNYTATLTANDGFNPAVSSTVAVTVTDILFPFNWDVDATTHLKNLNQDVTVPTGNFTGVVDLTTGQLGGDITLPPASFTFNLAGVGLVTANMQIAETQSITGTLDVSTFAVSATAVFDIKIVSLAPTATPTVNLVGNSCKTSTPVSVTMQGTANLTGSSTFSGTYTIPPLQNCGLLTTALNVVIPGPGNTFSATVYPPPVPPAVTTQPADQTVAAGQTYAFTAAASGTPDPSAQWQVSTDGGSTFTNITGATDPSYTATASLSDSGKQFRAVFTNPSGNATTNAATLTVVTVPDAPTIGTATAALGAAKVTFTAPANNGGSAILDYTAQCTSSDTGTPGSVTGATSPLTVTGLTAGSTYTCVVTARNAIGSSAASSPSNQVVPLAPPAITTEPTDQTVVGGQSYSFSAAASGTPAPTVQWQISTDQGTTFQNISGATSDTLTRTANVGDNDTNYRAVFTNSSGTATTNAAHLAVTIPHTISIGNASVVAGDSVKNHTVNLEVTLSQQSAQNVTVHYATANGTATAPNDFVAKSGNLTFKPGKTVLYVAVAVTPTNDGTETFQVVLSSPGGGFTLAPNHSTATVTIMSDNPSAGLQVSVGDATICRAYSGPLEVAKVLVSLSSPATATVTVNLALTAGTAIAGTDYKAWTSAKTLTFLAGQFQKVITVSVIPGSGTQDKTAFLTLSSPSSGLTISRSVGTLTIANHD